MVAGDALRAPRLDTPRLATEQRIRHDALTDTHDLVDLHIGFVSSNCWDAIGAKSYGFSVYWINRSGAPVDRMGFKPDRILESLDEILK